MQVEEATPAGEVEPETRTWELGTPPVGEGDDDAAAGGDAAQDAKEEEGSETAASAGAAEHTDAAEEAGTEEGSGKTGKEAAEELAAAEAKTIPLPGGGQWQVSCDEDACEVRQHTRRPASPVLQVSRSFNDHSCAWLRVFQSIKPLEQVKKPLFNLVRKPRKAIPSHDHECRFASM